MTQDEVLAIARAGAAAGCREALFTLGDKPELATGSRARSCARSAARRRSSTSRVRAARARRDGPSAAPQPRRHDARGARAPAPGLGLDGDHAGDDGGAARRAGRPALGIARQDPGAAPRDDPARRRARDPVHERDPDRDRRDARGADRRPARAAALGEEHGHVQEVIVQNFRAKPGTRMAAHPEPRSTTTCGRSRSRGSCSARLARAGAAEPRLRRLPAPARRGHRRLGRRLAGDDRPRQPGGAVARGRASRGGDARAGSSSRRDSHLPRVRRIGALERSGCRAVRPPSADALGLARDDAWAPGEPVASRSSAEATRLPLELAATSWARTSSRACSSRAGRSGARPRRRRRAPTRGPRRRGHVRRHPEHPVHERLLLPLRFLRLLEGKLAANLRGPVSRPARGDRAARARGVGARRDRGLPPGRDPSRRSPATTTPTSCARSRRRSPASTSTRSRRSRSGKAPRRSASRSSSTSRTCATSVSARCRVLPPRCSTTRCAASSARTR